MGGPLWGQGGATSLKTRPEYILRLFQLTVIP